MSGHTGTAPNGNATSGPGENGTAPAEGDGGGGVLGVLSDVTDWFADPEHILFARIAATIIIFGAAVVFARFARRQLRRAAERTSVRSRLDPWQTRALISRTQPLSLALAIAGYIAAVAVILAVWQMQTAFVSLLTAAGFAGIVIGLAASNSLSNLIAGFMIFYNHPFDIGDWVQIENVQGIVLEVKPGTTVIESWDGEKISFPNRVIDSVLIINKSHQRKLRWRFTVGVDYATDIERARELLLRIISGHPEVLRDPEPQVIATGFGDSSINLEVRFWIEPLRASGLAIQTWLMQEIQRGFAKEGIVIPFPQRTMVWRFPEGNAPPGETVSGLAYDPAQDARPVPSAPELRPEGMAPQDEAAHPSPRALFERLLRREGRRIAALKGGGGAGAAGRAKRSAAAKKKDDGGSRGAE